MGGGLGKAHTTEDESSECEKIEERVLSVSSFNTIIIQYSYLNYLLNV